MRCYNDEIIKSQTAYKDCINELLCKIFQFGRIDEVFCLFYVRRDAVRPAHRNSYAPDTKGEMQVAKKWLVRLGGHAFDLEELQEQLQSDEISIQKRNDNYYLSSSYFTDLPRPDDVLSTARRLIELMNGAAKIFINGYEPVSPTGEIIEVVDSEERRHVILQADTGHFRIRGKALRPVISSDGRDIEGKKPTEIIDLLRKAIGNPRIADVLHFQSLEQTWSNLYKVYELVSEDIGTKNVKKIVEKDRIKRFTATAQSRDLIGDDARHAIRKYKGPGKLPEMTLSEAKQLIADLLKAWISEK